MSESFHGTPITPDTLLMSLKPRTICCCISYWRPDQMALLARIARKVMIDCGAYSIFMANRRAMEKWRQACDAALAIGAPLPREPVPVVVDRAFREGYLSFVRHWIPLLPAGSFFVPFDEIDAGTQVQNALLEELPEGMIPYAWPVWHMDEPLERAIGLLIVYGKMCVGSTGEFLTVGSKAWRAQMDALFNLIKATFGDDLPPIHMLRGMQCQKDNFDYPFVSVDSTDVGRNHNRLNEDVGDLTGMTKLELFQGRIAYWEQHNCPTVWPPLRLAHSAPPPPPPAHHPSLPGLRERTAA